MSTPRNLFRAASAVAALAVGAAVLALAVDAPRAPALALAAPAELRARPALPPAGVVETRGRERDPVVLARSPSAPDKPVEIACATCHGPRASNPSVRSERDLDLFHQPLSVKHGDLACVACHAPPAYDGLRLADGERIPYADAMRLCAQCHGPQRRDYDRGAHGGMAGHWDLERGGRVRNACIACHDPHAPAFPEARPARGPNDRFLTNGEAHE